MNSLRDAQIGAIEKILNLNQTIKRDGDDEQSTTNGGITSSAPILGADNEPVWKVLVFDDLSRDVISTILRVQDLRKLGITIHLSISTTRHMIPDVPVIYLVSPSSQNVKAIASDLGRGLYSPAHVNFLSSVPRPVLEEFATEIATAGVSEMISSVYDQYLNFITPEPDLFSLGMGTGSYWAMNSGQVSDEEMDSTVDRIVSGLFSVVVTMGVIPIIRCAPKGAAEVISAKLDRKLRDHILSSKDNLFSDSKSKSTSRPVLIIVERTVDLVPLLSHSWTYHSLVHDVLKMHLNRISVEVPTDEANASKGGPKKSYDITSNDFFWARNESRPFPTVAESIDAELSKYREDANEVTRKTGASSIEDLDTSASNSAQNLKAAITLLPELRERKSTLDMHMNILSALLKGIKDRGLDSYYEIEEAITKQTKAQILDLVKATDKGNEPLDKLRLFIIWYLSIDQEVSRTEMESFESALQEAGADTTALAYIKHVRQITRMTMMSTASAQQTQPSASSNVFGLGSLQSRLAKGFEEAGISARFDNLVSGVKTIIPKNRDLTLTKICESICDPQNASSSAIGLTQNYLYFDPRNANARGTMPPASQARGQQAGMPGALNGVGRGIEATFSQRRQGFNEAIVFTVGGGSIDEYCNLKEYAQRGAPNRRLVYGSTELLNAEEFVTKELGRLGQESA